MSLTTPLSNLKHTELCFHNKTHVCVGVTVCIIVIITEIIVCVL